MRRLILTPVLALAALPALAGAAGAAPVKVGDNFFNPTSKRIAVGSVVKFKWVGSRRHHIVKTSGPGGPIASRTTDDRGVNLVKRFGRRGTYRFICTLHPQEMRFTLRVR